MSKFVLLLVLSVLCLLQAQAQRTRKPCENLTRVCVKNQRITGPQDDVTKYVNADCRRSNPRWKDVTRCQLERAACELTLVKCGALSCANIAKALQGIRT